MSQFEQLEMHFFRYTTPKFIRQGGVLSKTPLGFKDLINKWYIYIVESFRNLGKVILPFFYNSLKKEHMAEQEVFDKTR